MATDRPASTAAKLPHSRLCPGTSAQPATEQPYLFEALRELAFETCLEVAGNSLRIGLACSAWQLEQARILLEHFQPASRKSLASPSSHEVAVALALPIVPGHKSRRARGVISLRRDSAAGLALDARHSETLDALRAAGGRLVEVESLAFDQQIPLQAILNPMIRALAGAVENWGTTDILAECPRLDAGFYCAKLGFKRLQKGLGSQDKVLLHLTAQRIARLQLRATTS